MNIYRCTCVTSLLFLIILCGASITSGSYKPYSMSARDKPPWERDFSSSRKEPPSRCTKQDLPCFPVILTYIRDGVCSFSGPDPQFYRKHFAKIGIRGVKAIAEKGRQAAGLIFQATGLDFRDLPDDAYLYAKVMTRDGSITFQPNRFEDECKYRLTTLQIKEKTQFINKLASTVAWSVIFNEDTKVGGTINAVLPKGTFYSAGSYVILPCERNKDKNCQSIHNPENPYEPITFAWKERIYDAPAFQPGGFVVLNLDLNSEEWGEGRGLGISYPEDDGTVDGTQVLKFPSRVSSNH